MMEKERCKVLLINPPNNFISDYPPLGLGYLASTLEKDGFNVKIFDMAKWSWDKDFNEISKVIKKEEPFIVGITSLTDSRLSSFKMVKLVKEIIPESKIVMGGPHPTFLYEQILQNFPVDFIVRGEGEITFLELTNKLATNTSPKDVKGIAFKDNEKIIKNPDRPLITNLDCVPFPAYHLLDMDSYMRENLAPWMIQIEKEEAIKIKKGYIITSRGCPFNCIFCSTSKFWGRMFRARSPRNVVDEIEFLHEKYKINYFFIIDDTFTIDQQRVVEICKEILQRKLDIFWMAETRPDYVSDELFYWMRKAGCNLIEFGVESGSPLILKKIKKQISISQIIKAFKLAKKYNLKTLAFIMVGNPGESKKTVEQTIKLLNKIRPDYMGVAATRIYPQTELFDMAKRKGLINDEYWFKSEGPVVYTGAMDTEQIYYYAFLINLHFWKRKGIIPLTKYTVSKVLTKPQKAIETLSFTLRKLIR